MLKLLYCFKEALLKLLLVITTVFFSSLNLHAHERIQKGEKISLGKGWAYTYIAYDFKNRPKSLGVVLTEGALKSLPHVDTSYLLKLPKGVTLPPYKEVMLDWNAHGHEPADVYDIPHFDFHFYAITKKTRQAIKCMDEDNALCLKQPAADYIPAYYIPTPAGVPMMGWHWLDSRSPELQGDRFTSTFIYGYYDAKIIFLEPMITREFLLSHGHVNAELPLPKKFAFNGYYPKKYNVHYDAKTKIYRIALNNLVYR